MLIQIQLLLKLNYQVQGFSHLNMFIQIQLLLKLNSDWEKIYIKKSNSNTTLVKVK